MERPCRETIRVLGVLCTYLAIMIAFSCSLSVSLKKLPFVVVVHTVSTVMTFGFAWFLKQQIETRPWFYLFFLFCMTLIMLMLMCVALI